jgi:hypothetical protein
MTGESNEQRMMIDCVLPKEVGSTQFYLFGSTSRFKIQTQVSLAALAGYGAS